MKRLFALCFVVAGFSFLIFYPAVLPAQTTKSAPGLYVSGWPAFTITYPADWVELPPERMQVFRVAPPGPIPLPALTISVFSNTLPLESTPSMIVPVFERIGKNVKVLNKKTIRLKDGVPAFEAELEWELTPVGKVNTLLFSTAKEDVWVLLTLSDQKGMIGEDLKSIAYSLKMRPGKEDLVKVPDDVQEFLQGYDKALEEHDMEKAMDYYSPEFLQYGMKKQGVEQFLQTIILRVNAMEPRVTGFERQGDKAYLTGFWSGNFGKTSMAMGNSFLVKENGKWKWYGNQK